MDTARVRLERPIYLTREQNTFKLAFKYDEALVEKARGLPYARFDSETRSWSVDVTKQAVDILRDWFTTEGLTDVCVDELLEDGEVLKEAPPATLRRGSLKRPFVVITGTRDEALFTRLKTIAGAQWERQLGGMSYPSTSAAALSELAARGILADPEGVLTPAAITVTFDGRTGVFKVLGDHRAAAAFERYFPERDVVGAWKDKGFDVAFSDAFTEEVYRGEIARVGDGLRPQGLINAELFDYQARAVAVAVERSGFGIYDAPGLGKSIQGVAWALELIENRQEAQRAVIVVPGAIKTQFGREITRFTGHEDVVVIDGPKKKREELYEQAKEARWVVLNYDLLHLDYKRIAPLVSGQLLIADEAHRCFPGGTMVDTDRGPIQIGRIVDEGLDVKVRAFDEETGEIAYRPVTARMKSRNDDLMVVIVHARGTLTATMTHPVFVVDRGWVDASTIESGDRLLVVDGAGDTESQVQRILTVSGGLPVYNLEVEGPHTYYANGVLVHNCKNRQSKRTMAMRQLAQKAIKRLALTGTPVENNPSEWYTLFNTLVAPGILGSPTEFFNRYSYPGRFGGYEGARNLRELRDRSKPHYIRHTKEEVATHLPPLMVQNLVLDPDDKLAAALKRAHRDAQAEIAEARKEKAEAKQQFIDGEAEEQIESGAAMTAVGMLRLMCSSPRLIHMSDSDSAKAMVEAGLIPDEDGPKLDQLRELALELQNAGERLVCFTSFRSMAKLIAQRFDEDGVRYVLFTGESTTKERDAAATAFTTASTAENPGPTVFLATDAAAEGLNLGKCCSTLVNFDLAFKPSTMIQRANRIHRVDGDTTKKYLVINYTLTRTIEEGILAMVGAKADLSDAILGESGSRRRTTGRGGRNVFEEALAAWRDNN